MNHSNTYLLSLHYLPAPMPPGDCSSRPTRCSYYILYNAGPRGWRRLAQSHCSLLHGLRETTWHTEPMWQRYHSRKLAEKTSREAEAATQKLPPFYGIWSSLQCSYEPSIGTCSLRSMLILSTHLRLGLPSGPFPSDLPTNILYAFAFAPFVLYALPAHLILLDLIGHSNLYLAQRVQVVKVLIMHVLSRLSYTDRHDIPVSLSEGDEIMYTRQNLVRFFLQSVLPHKGDNLPVTSLTQSVNCLRCISFSPLRRPPCYGASSSLAGDVLQI
jgi:hypothetical protein